MTIHVALHHKTTYDYDRQVSLSPQIIRLRPAPHSRTPIHSYSLRVSPEKHFVNWQQDPQGNYLARIVFNEPVDHFHVEVDLVAEMTVINPFDFFLEPNAENFPIRAAMSTEPATGEQQAFAAGSRLNEYAPWLAKELKPFLEVSEPGEKLKEMLAAIDVTPRRTVNFLVDLNNLVHHAVKYTIRMEPGVQTPDETLTKGSGSCRDSAWLLVQLLRNMGLAARFVSGYLIQLVADVKSLDGPSGPTADFTDLHAWAEVYLPGAGWIGLDATSGLFAGEGHIPVACTPDPDSAAPITGGIYGAGESKFNFNMKVTRVLEDPRVTLPYTEEDWAAIEALGHEVDARLKAGDVRLTMGGEPTFVSIDDQGGDEWNTAAVGPTKRKLATKLIHRLKNRFASGGLLHFGQGKWYPGESLPRWALGCYWRTDGEPVWRNPELFADPDVNYGHTTDDAQRFMHALADRLGVNRDHAIFGFEDVLYYTWKERRLPVNVNVLDSKMDNEEERERIARLFEKGITTPTGCVLPLQYQWWHAQPGWRSGLWPVRSDEMFLLPGDSPMGLRLPLQSLTWTSTPGLTGTLYEQEPFAPPVPLAEYTEFRRVLAERQAERVGQRQVAREAVGVGEGASRSYAGVPYPDGYPGDGNGNGGGRNGNGSPRDKNGNGVHDVWPYGDSAELPSGSHASHGGVIRFAMCIEPRGGCLYVFMPPVEQLEHYLDLIAAVEDTSESLDLPAVIEGYLPPHDSRLKHLKVTPDPGVIEVNVQPAKSWDELVAITTGVYEDAYYTRLGTEKFDQDGGHTGTGGGNHVVLGGATPADSPFLRRPDLLRSLVGFWHNHPSLSYLFSCKFIGPTSQAPRVDEGRRDSIYELGIAFEQLKPGEPAPPWLVDRVFRHLLVDGTGNTHRAEFCIDKLYSPDSPTGRLGLVEFRGFEMPPHARMSLTQQLLLRALVARFWDQPYTTKLANWNTSIHDRFLLPHFVRQDFSDVIEETRMGGIPIEERWFDTHFEFRFPKIGEISQRGIRLELRDAIEPWYVLGEEAGGAATARYVDSSVERMQVKVQGMTDTRHVITVNGRKVPLFPTGTEGEFVAGVRYRAWQPPSCLHPTIPVDEPLVFDVLDTWMNRSVGGCRYHVGHPGGNNPESYPINSLEAESRRASRFFKFGHTAGGMPIPSEEPNPAFPLTLDLRRGRNRS